MHFITLSGVVSTLPATIGSNDSHTAAGYTSPSSGPEAGGSNLPSSAYLPAPSRDGI